MIIYNSIVGNEWNSECESIHVNQTSLYCSKTIHLSNRSLIKSLNHELQEFKIMEKENSEKKTCFGCDDSVLITESFYELKQITKGVFKERFHLQCLSCYKCSNLLTESDDQCWIRDGKVVCKECKKRMTYCQRCNTLVSGDAWVHRLNDFPFHISCFTCCICTRQLSKGEKCSLMEDKLFCHDHFLEFCNGPTEHSSESSGKSRLKRIRTSFTPEQLTILQAHFESECNPDGQELEKIANSAQLNKRVTQVWFQNARARKKKSGKTYISTTHVINGNLRYGSPSCGDSNSNNGLIDTMADDDKMSTDSSSCISSIMSKFRFKDSNLFSTINLYPSAYVCNNKIYHNNHFDNENNTYMNNEKSPSQFILENKFADINEHNNVHLFKWE